MNHIEDEYRKRFHNQQLPNDGFAAEELWNDIVQDLDRQKRKIGPFWLIALTLCIGIASLLGWHWYTKHLPSKDSLPIKGEFATQEAQQPTEAKTTYHSIDSTVDNISSDDKRQEVLTAVSNFRVEKTIEQLESTTPKAPHQQNTNPTAETTKSLTLESAISRMLPQTTEKEQVAGAIFRNPNSTHLVNNPTQHLPQRPIPFLDFNQLTRLKAITPTLPSPNPKHNQTHWHLAFLGGSNQLSFKHKSANTPDLEKLKNETDHAFYGLSLGASTTVQWNPHWRAVFGLEYHQLTSKFEYTQQEAFQLLKPGVPVRIWVDDASNDTINIEFRDTLVDAITTRQVVHYNEFQVFSLPLLIGFQQDVGKFTYGIDAGLVLNLSLQQSGKTLNQNASIVSFDQDSITAPLQKLGIGFRLSPFASFTFSEQWSIIARPQWTWHSSKSFDDTDSKVSAQQLNLNVGLRYQLR